MALEFVALAAAIQTLIKPEDIAATMTGGILGNRTDALFVEAMKALRENKLKDINHDVERASLAALREAIRIFAAEVAERVGGKPPLLAAYQRRKREHTLGGQPLLEFRQFPEHIWLNKLQHLARNDAATQQLHERLHSDEDAILAALQKSEAEAQTAQRFHALFQDWLDEHLPDTAGQPAFLAEFVQQGWPLEAGERNRITLHQTWHLFFTEQVKHKPEVFNKLVLELLAKLSRPDAKLADRQAFEAALDQPLAAINSSLARIINTLDRIDGKVDGLADSLNRIESKLDPALAERRQADTALKIDIGRVLRYRPGELFGREAELAQLNQAFQGKQTRVFSLIAFGGVGKTALAAFWLGKLAEADWPGLERVFGWSFYSQGNRDDSAASSDAFFSAAFAFFGESGPALALLSPWDKGARLAACVAARVSLLVLDGLEPLQHPPGALDGRLKDQAIEALLLGLAQGLKRGLCLLTSREPVKELDGVAKTQALPLDFLSDEAGAKLLHSGIVRHTRDKTCRAGQAAIAADDPELRLASREVAGHALTLHLLGLYLAKAHGGDLRQRGTVELAQADQHYKTNAKDLASPYGHAFKMMAAYERWLAQGGVEGERQLAVLRMLGLFDRPADPACLAALRAGPVIEGLTEPLFHSPNPQYPFGLSLSKPAAQSPSGPSKPIERPSTGSGRTENAGRMENKQAGLIGKLAKILFPRLSQSRRNAVIPAGRPESSHRDVNLPANSKHQSNGQLPSMALDSGLPAGTTEYASAPLPAPEWNHLIADLAAAKLLQTADYPPPVLRGYDEVLARKAMEHKARNEIFPLGEPPIFQVKPEPLALGPSLDAHPLLRDYFARRLQETYPEAWRIAQRRLFAHLCANAPYWPEGADGLQPLYQAVAHGCRAGLHEQARAEVYRDRILRRGEVYSTNKLGLFGADLGAIAGLFDPPWREPVAALSAADRAWLLSEAAYSLRGLGRLGEALEPMRAGMQMYIEQENWNYAARVAGNLSELAATLGRVDQAVAYARLSVDYAERSGDAFIRIVNRTMLADALHLAGLRGEALQAFREAETIKAEWQPHSPLLTSLSGFGYCDALLAEAERAAWRRLLPSPSDALLPSPLGRGAGGEGFWTTNAAEVSGKDPHPGPPSTPLRTGLPEGEGVIAACHAVAERAAQTLAIAEQHFGPLAIALDHLSLARAQGAAALLTQDAAKLDLARHHAAAAVDGLRASGTQHHIPRGLLTRAWLAAAVGALCQRDSDATAAPSDASAKQQALSDDPVAVGNRSHGAVGALCKRDSDAAAAPSDASAVQPATTDDSVAVGNRSHAAVGALCKRDSDAAAAPGDPSAGQPALSDDPVAVKNRSHGADDLVAVGNRSHDAAALLSLARADLDEAERIARRGDMRLHLADVHLHRARLFADHAALAQARELIGQCGYGRRKGELEDAEAALGGSVL